MAVTVGGAKLKVDPLALLFPVVTMVLGPRAEVAALLVSLAAHEAGHLIAARALGVGVSQLRLMPFGAAIRLDNPYTLSPGRLLAVAAAGPAGSLLALIGAAALAHWRALSPMFALALMRVSAVLMLFNLLPALPLDGGRMLYALLSERVGRSRAVDIGIWIGRAVAALLVAFAICAALARGRLNLSPLFAAVFILASAHEERRALGDARLRALLSELKPIAAPIPARLLAVGGDCCVRDALRAARADALTLYAVYKDSRLTSFTDDRRLLRLALNSGFDVRIDQSINEACCCMNNRNMI